MLEEPKEYWHVFLPLMPLASAEEQKDIRRVTERTVRTKDELELWVCLMGCSERLDAIAISYRHNDEEKCLPWVSRLFDHAYASLVMAYNPLIRALYTPEGFLTFGRFSDDKLPKKWDVVIGWNEPLGNSGINPQKVFDLMFSTIGQREAIGALSEANRPYIPKHYRFLSLVRSLELLIPDKKDRREWLERYDGKFQEASKTAKKFQNFVEELRNRCAHGVGTGTPDPIISLGMNGSPDMNAAFDTLIQAVTEKIVEYGAVQFEITPKSKPTVYSPNRPSDIKPPPVVIERHKS